MAGSGISWQVCGRKLFTAGGCKKLRQVFERFGGVVEVYNDIILCVFGIEAVFFKRFFDPYLESADFV